MKEIFYTLSFLVLLSFGCQKKLADLSSKKSTDSEKLSAGAKKLINQVEILRNEGGRLLCSGVDMETFRFVRTLAHFDKGSLQSLSIKGYLNKEKPENVPSELSLDFEDYKIFEFEPLKSALSREVDLSGKKFGIEVFSAVSGHARKMYDLRFEPKDDVLDPNLTLLRGTLDFKNIEAQLDISELSVGCTIVSE